MNSQEELIQITNAVDILNECLIAIEFIAYLLGTSESFPIIFRALHRVAAVTTKAFFLVNEFIVTLERFFVLQTFKVTHDQATIFRLP